MVQVTLPTLLFYPQPTLFFLHFGQTVHLKKKKKKKKKTEGKACILNDFFFFDMNPIALRKAKIVYNFGISMCNRVKRKTIVLSKT